MDEQNSNNRFPETRWTMVYNARDGQDTAKASRALNDLCGMYWKPLYLYARNRGCSQQDAEDLTQSFLLKISQNKFFNHADEDRGRLRCYMLGSFNNHIKGAALAVGTKKRGGDFEIQPVPDFEEVEHLIKANGNQPMNPDFLYDRQCAVAMVEEVLRLVGAEQATKGNEKFFEAVKLHLDPLVQCEKSQEDIASELGMNVGALRVALKRLRTRFRKALRDAVRDTLYNPTEEEIDAELRDLISTLSG